MLTVCLATLPWYVCLAMSVLLIVYVSVSLCVRVYARVVHSECVLMFVCFCLGVSLCDCVYILVLCVCVFVHSRLLM